MSDKHFDAAGAMFAVGIGGAMLAGYLILGTMARMSMAGRPSKMFGTSPVFPTGRVTELPARKTVAAAVEEVEAIPTEAPMLRVVPVAEPEEVAAPEPVAEVVEALTDETVPVVDAPEEPVVEPTRLTVLTEAREGGADDLKLIKGVGPKLAALLNSLGYFHFDQIAAWGAEELEFVDANLQGFAGRATRDNWIEQAKALATGAASSD